MKHTLLTVVLVLLGCQGSVAGTGGASSSSSAADMLACPPGWANCDESILDACETNIATNPGYCGGCDVDHECLLAHAVNGCDGGACIVIGCDPGAGNCDGVDANGCETDLVSDADNCGGCGVSCAPGGYCDNGVCEEAP